MVLLVSCESNHGTTRDTNLCNTLVWLTKQRSTPGPVFGSVDNFEGLGIFFDTYDNERAHVSVHNSTKKKRISL